eukprot:gene23120-11787_t
MPRRPLRSRHLGALSRGSLQPTTGTVLRPEAPRRGPGMDKARPPPPPPPLHPPPPTAAAASSIGTAGSPTSGVQLWRSQQFRPADARGGVAMWERTQRMQFSSKEAAIGASPRDEETLSSRVRRLSPPSLPPFDAALRGALAALPLVWHADELARGSRLCAEGKAARLASDIARRGLSFDEVWAIVVYTWDHSLCVDGWDKADYQHNFYAQFNLANQARDDAVLRGVAPYASYLLSALAKCPAHGVAEVWRGVRGGPAEAVVAGVSSFSVEER